MPRHEQRGSAMAPGALYAVQVESGQEQRMCELLCGWMPKTTVGRAFVPMREEAWAKQGVWQRRLRVLIPGYIFVQTQAPADFSQKLRAIPKFTRLLGSDGTQFTPLTPNDVVWLKTFSANSDDYVAQMSRGFIEGDEVVVTEGPLRGLESKIVHIDRHKRLCTVETELLGRKTPVKVGLEIVWKR